MSQFLVVSRHAPENCPLGNERTKKITLDIVEKLPTLAKKDGIKVLNIWSSLPEHTLFQALEVPSLEALQKFYMEPELMKFGMFNTTESKQVVPLEETVKLPK